MPSGQEIAKQNLAAFEQWCQSKTDAELREIVWQGRLNKKEIAQECGFARSVVDQNPAIRQRLMELEQGLRERGVLPRQTTDKTEIPKPNRSGDVNVERLRRLESENAQLRAEIRELKQKLATLASLSDILSETGRLPR